MGQQNRDSWEQNIIQTEGKIVQIQDELSNLCNLVTRLRHMMNDEAGGGDSRDKRQEQQMSNTKEEENGKLLAGCADPQTTCITVMPSSQEQNRTLKLDKAAAKRLVLRHLNLK